MDVLVSGAQGLTRARDAVAEETPVALHYNGEPHAVMMLTPADLEDFALGFSVTEAVIDGPGELQAVELRAAGAAIEIHMRIPLARQAALARRRRSLEGRTGCGVCGAQSLADAEREVRRVPAGQSVTTAALVRALAALRRRQPLNARTGATHAAAWADASGEIGALREDVGRHNALDKLAGHLLRSGAPTAQGMLLLTSRASYEMVVKASMLGMPVVVAISAPTAYAVRLAEEAGITLIAFARQGRYVVYAGAGRLGLAAEGGRTLERPA